MELILAIVCIIAAYFVGKAAERADPHKEKWPVVTGHEPERQARQSTSPGK